MDGLCQRCRNDWDNCTCEDQGWKGPYPKAHTKLAAMKGISEAYDILGNIDLEELDRQRLWLVTLELHDYESILRDGILHFLDAVNDFLRPETLERVRCIDWFRPGNRGLFNKKTKAHILLDVHCDPPYNRTECGISLDDVPGMSVWETDLSKINKSVNACKACLRIKNKGKQQ